MARCMASFLVYNLLKRQNNKMKERENTLNLILVFLWLEPRGHMLVHFKALYIATLLYHIIGVYQTKHKSLLTEDKYCKAAAIHQIKQYKLKR